MIMTIQKKHNEFPYFWSERAGFVVLPSLIINAKRDTQVVLWHAVRMFRQFRKRSKMRLGRVVLT